VPRGRAGQSHNGSSDYRLHRSYRLLIIRHLNKDSKVTDPILRGGGSIGIIAAARAGRGL